MLERPVKLSFQVTVEHQLKALLPGEANIKLAHSFHFVHRIDYPTSGVLCLALNKKAASQAAKAFSNRNTKKYYIALLRGHVAQELVDISLPIGILHYKLIVQTSRPNNDTSYR